MSQTIHSLLPSLKIAALLVPLTTFTTFGSASDFALSRESQFHFDFSLKDKAEPRFK